MTSSELGLGLGREPGARGRRAGLVGAAAGGRGVTAAGERQEEREQQREPVGTRHGGAPGEGPASPPWRGGARGAGRRGGRRPASEGGSGVENVGESSLARYGGEMRAMGWAATRRLLRVSGLLLALVLGAGCGGPEADILSKIQARGALVVATEAEFRPFEYVEPSGEIVGFDVDLAGHRRRSGRAARAAQRGVRQHHQRAQGGLRRPDRERHDRDGGARAKRALQRALLLHRDGAAAQQGEGGADHLGGAARPSARRSTWDVVAGR